VNRRAVAYIRRSSGKESRVSLTAQTETVQRLAAENDQTIAEVCQDWGRSGGSESRPRYMQMVADSSGEHRLALLFARVSDLDIGDGR
jgi:hypothetical protein